MFDLVDARYGVDMSSHRFQDRVVVVTGGTGALGRAVVAQLLAEGGTVHVPVFHEGQRAGVEESPRLHLHGGVDLTSEASTERFFAAVGGVFASIHVAGGFAMGPIETTSGDEFERLMRLNAGTCFNTCRAAVEAMRADGGGGRIVNVAARPAIVPTGGMVAYAASKAAVASMTRCLAEEVAAEGIWVNAIVPSIMDTPANRAAMPDVDPSSWPTTQEVASTICFLASPENASTRGALVQVDGRA